MFGSAIKAFEFFFMMVDPGKYFAEIVDDESAIQARLKELLFNIAGATVARPKFAPTMPILYLEFALEFIDCNPR
jgi:hypothetical protein